MKKIKAILAMIVMLLVLVSCGENPKKEKAPSIIKETVIHEITIVEDTIKEITFQDVTDYWD